MEIYEKKELNEYQKGKFEEFGRNSAESYFDKYKDVLENLPRDRKIKILDMGGGSGYFALALRRFFLQAGYDAEIFVLDITRYAAWEQDTGSVHFVEGSVFDVKKYFERNMFDIVFLNRVCHHLVQPSWKKTVDGISALLCLLREILKDDGRLCVSECYYEMKVFKNLSSFVIYTLSSIKNPYIAKLLRFIGSKSAGVGVCFLSVSQWEELLERAGYEILNTLENPVRTLKKLPIKERFFFFIAKISNF